MATISFYDFAIRPMIHNLKTAIHITKKAQEHCQTTSTPETKLIHARLYEDMYTFHGQIYQLQKSPLHLLQRLEINDSAADDTDGGDGTVTDPPNQSGTDPEITTLQQCIEMLESTLSALTKPGGAEARIYSDSQFSRKVRARYGAMDPFVVTKGEFAQAMILPNVFFHTSTAYGILRSQGVPLGKSDYLRPFFEEAVDYEGLLAKVRAKMAAAQAEKENGSDAK